MATQGDIDQVRLQSNLDADDPTLNYETLESYVDLVGVSGATAKVWLIKAGRYADLCDVAEAGASERLGQLRDQAIEMALKWTEIAAGEDAVANPDPTAGRVKLHSLTRSTG